MVPPAQSVQLGVTVPGMVPLFSHGPVWPLVKVAFGTEVNEMAFVQLSVVGKVGNIMDAGVGGSTTILLDVLITLPQASVKDHDST